MENIIGPRQLWQTGMWWIIKTSFLKNISKIPDSPDIIGIEEYFHRYTVVGKEKVGRQDAWVIDINAINIPPEFKNDQGKKYLWRLFLNTDNFTLIKLLSSTRSGNFLVTGDQCKNDSIEFRLGKPAVVTGLIPLTPLEFPSLPTGNDALVLEEHEKELDFTNELSFQEYKQFIVSVVQQIGNKNVATWYISLVNKEYGISTHFWVPGLPWWKEWHHVSLERQNFGMFKAELIDWGPASR